MARIRTIKPSFWAHEELSALPEATHMLAGALLNYSDDHGYFNANVGLIRATCSPLREPSVSIPESIQSLQAMGYVRLGTAPDGKRYGQVVNFTLHQKVSHPTKSNIAEISIVWEASGISPEPVANPPEPLRPEGNKEKEREEEGEKKEVAPPAASVPSAPPIIVPRETSDDSDDPLDIPLLVDRTVEADAVRAWNQLARRTGVPAVMKITATRRTGLKARLKEHGLDGWNEALAKIEASPFLTGTNDRGWKADIDFLLRDSKFTKLMEGGYAGRSGGSSQSEMDGAFERMDRRVLGGV